MRYLIFSCTLFFYFTSNVIEKHQPFVYICIMLFFSSFMSYAICICNVLYGLNGSIHVYILYSLCVSDILVLSYLMAKYNFISVSVL